MIRIFTAAAVSAALAIAGPAMAGEAAAASLASLNGAVSVNQAGRMAPAKLGALKAGDRVIARDGQAKLTYADGCVVTLKPQSMATIAAKSPCVSQQGLVTAGSASAQSSFSELSPFGMVMGVLAVGGFIYGVVSILTNDDTDDNISVNAPISF